MKQNVIKQNLLLLIVLIFVLGITTNFPAKDKMQFSKTQVANLIEGIKSENNGLKMHSIYLAGKYKVEEAADEIINQLQGSEDIDQRRKMISALTEIMDTTNNYKLSELEKQNRLIQTRGE